MTAEGEAERPSPIAGEAYHDLIREQLQDAATTKDSLERRGLAVVTTAGAVLAVILGVASFVGSRPTVPAGTIQLAGAALIGLIVAIVSGLIVNFPLGYADVATSDLRMLADSQDFWVGPFAKGMQRVAQVEVDALETARDANRRKALTLRIGIGLEAGSFILLGAAGVLVLRSLIV